MNKKLFHLIVFLMTVSFVGIVLLQWYWVENAKAIYQQEFRVYVNTALQNTATKIEKRELADFTYDLDAYLQNHVESTHQEIRDFFSQKNTNNLIVASIFNSNADVLGFIEEHQSEHKFPLLQARKKQKKKQKKTLNYNKLRKTDKAFVEELYSSKKGNRSIYTRTSKEEIYTLLKKQFERKDIDQEFQFAVFQNKFRTSIASDFYQSRTKIQKYKVRLFPDQKGKDRYFLRVYFPQKEAFLFGKIKHSFWLTMLFIVIMLVTFATALYMLVYQKRLSVMKTDFINNMTHEFKTPIAAINLATDAIKNPKVINDEVRVKKYTNIIKEENKRMLNFVNNVLEIAQLEDANYQLNKERLNILDVVEDAVATIDILLSAKNGEIKIDSSVDGVYVNGNEAHLTNVFVNILENAIKYTEQKPKIIVYIYKLKKDIVVGIQDNGVGMDAATVKHLFEKFYREHSGNIHNVKGYGIGLTYVKSIVERHQGKIKVVSEKGKGSEFRIHLPSTN